MSSRFAPILLLVLTCVLLAALYSVGLTSRAVWYDEAITIQSLAAEYYSPPPPGLIVMSELRAFVEGVTTLPEVIRRYVETDVHPPLYFAFAHGATLVLGNDLAVVRAVSLVLVLASVFLYGRALQAVGEPGLWIGLAVYGLSFAAVTTAQDARGYSMALLLVVAAWRVLAVRDGTRPSPSLRSDILLGLICGALLLTHYFALFIVVPLLGWQVIEALLERRPAGLAAPLIAALMFAPWLPVMLDHLGDRPGQMTGFDGLLAWIKLTAQLVPGQILSATHWAVPGAVQMLGRGLVVLVVAVGTIHVLTARGENLARRRLGLISVWALANGLLCFLIVSVFLDRWFNLPRYFLFLAPFVAYLAARGSIVIGRGIAAITGAGKMIVFLPGILLVLAELAMANFGWEANRNRGGSYFDSIAQQIASAEPDQSLAIIDVGNGRGNVLSAAIALPPKASAYLLDPDPKRWDTAADEIAEALEGRGTVILVYTIDRGSMGSDKSLLYGPIVARLELDGFNRVAAPPEPHGSQHYAKWERANGID